MFATRDQKRVVTVLQALKKIYPHAHIALNFRTPWELLVAVELSAQCTDLRVNTVTKTLFAKYPRLEDYVRADLHTFARDIKPTGFYRVKAKNILAAARMVQEKFGGRVPSSMAQILTIPGVARKTANVVLGNAYGVVAGIAVDTHVIRLSQRLRLVDLTRIGGKNARTFVRDGATVMDFKKDADPVKIEKELMAIIPKSQWLPVTYRIVDHGRAVCKAKNPQCDACALRAYCPASRVVV